MLENPFNFNSVYETHELFGLELAKPDVDVKAMVKRQAMQGHQGMIITQKDMAHLGGERFRSVELKQKFLNVTIKNDDEGKKIEREI